MSYARVHLATMTVDRTPLPAYLRVFSAEQLKNLDWVPADYENGEVHGYAWWMEVPFTYTLGQYERVTGETFSPDPVSCTVAVSPVIVPWTDEEIAADKVAQHLAAGSQIAATVDEYCNEVARSFGFFGSPPMLYALSFADSVLTEEAARALTLRAWRDTIKTFCNVTIAEVALTGIIPRPDQLRAAMPPAPALPVEQLPE